MKSNKIMCQYEVKFSNRAKMTVSTTSAERAIESVKRFGKIISVENVGKCCDMPDAWVFGYGGLK